MASEHRDELERELRKLFKEWIEISPINPSPNFNVGDCVKFLVQELRYKTSTSYSKKATIVAVLGGDYYKIEYQDSNGTQIEDWLGKYLFPC